MLATADRILAEGGLVADVCRALGVSHVVYGRLRARYSQEPPMNSSPARARELETQG